MTSLLDRLLLPAHLLGRALNDVHRIADAAASLGALASDLRDEMELVNTWMRTTASELESLREHAGGVQSGIEPMVEHVRILRDEFGRANDEIARLREVFGPELAALRDEFGRTNDEMAGLAGAFAPELGGLRSSAQAMLGEIAQVRELLGGIRAIGDRVSAEVLALNGSVGALVRDADEISDVVEPLQAATDRVGRVADRLPGGSRRRPR